MPQTVHAQNMPIAHPGMVADAGINQDVISRLAEADIRAGVFVAPGTDVDAQAVAPSSAAEITNGFGLGVVMYDASKEPGTSTTEYADEETLPLVQKGRVWVLCDAGATIVANTQAFVRYASGVGGSILGAFREDDPGTEAAALPTGVFRSAHVDVVFQADTYRVALLEINLPTA